MKRLTIILACFLSLLVLPGAALAQDTGQPLIVPAGETAAGNIATISQDVRVEGRVTGDVTSWSGAITIIGSVGGDVVSYGGPVTILAGGRVGGHVLASGGDLRVGPGALVAGQAIYGARGGDALASLLDLFTPVSGSGNGGVARALFGAVLGVLLLAFCLLYSAFWPGRMSIASTTLQRLAIRAVALGLVTSIALLLALPPLAAVLMSSVVGVPLLLALLALVLAGYIYALAVLARWAGAQLAARTPRPNDLGQLTIAVAVVLVSVITSVAALQPMWGMALFYLLASPGLGAAILSRGGMALPFARP